MFDFSSLFSGLSNPFENMSDSNMLSQVFKPQGPQPGQPLDITAPGMTVPPQAPTPTPAPVNAQSALSKRFQTLGGMGAAPQSQFSPVQFSAPQGNGLSQLIAQLMQGRAQ